MKLIDPLLAILLNQKRFQEEQEGGELAAGVRHSAVVHKRTKSDVTQCRWMFAEKIERPSASKRSIKVPVHYPFSTWRTRRVNNPTATRAREGHIWYFLKERDIFYTTLWALHKRVKPRRHLHNFPSKLIIFCLFISFSIGFLLRIKLTYPNLT